MQREIRGNLDGACSGRCAAGIVAGIASGIAADLLTPVFDEAEIRWDPELTDGAQAAGYTIHDDGHSVQRTLEMPRLPADHRDTQRIIATLIVEPVLIEEEGKIRPGDPWTRLGSVSLVLPENPASSVPARQPAGSATQPAATQPALREVELMRFITSFGGPSTFQQDLTAFAPLLSGPVTLRVSISTFKDPAWRVTLTLKHTAENVGYRRPALARRLFNEPSVTATSNKLRASVDIPKGLARPRIWVISTGHATDGTGGDEFISRTHILRVDGQEITRWRPWAEDGGSKRDDNPMSGRTIIDGRQLWSSDIDRSGWHPGMLIRPLQIPVPELSPGKHQVELEIVGIRPKDKNGYGYWRTSAVVVADEPWPDAQAPVQP